MLILTRLVEVRQATEAHMGHMDTLGNEKKNATMMKVKAADLFLNSCYASISEAAFTTEQKVAERQSVEDWFCVRLRGILFIYFYHFRLLGIKCK